MKYAKLHLLLY